MLPGMLLAPYVCGPRWWRIENLPAWLAGGMVWHLFSSAFFRMTLQPLGVPFVVYWSVPGAFLVLGLVQLWRSSPSKQQWGRFIAQFARIRYLFTLLGFLLVLAVFYGYNYRPLDNYYNDDNQRATIAQLIKVAYPPPEFHVFTDDHYRYYNLTELLAANLSELSGIDTLVTYFHHVFLLNWVLIFIGLWILINEPRKAPGWFSLLAFIFFGTAQGIGGAQKMGNLGLLQNSFALAMLFFGLWAIFRFYTTNRYSYFILAILTGSLVAGIKLVAFLPLMAAIPVAGIDHWIKGRIPFKQLGFAGVLSASSVLFWYYINIYNPNPHAQASLHFNPSHWFIAEYAHRITTQYGMTWFDGDGWERIYVLWFPWLFHLEPILLFLLGWSLTRRLPRELETNRLQASLIFIGLVGTLVFTLYEFDLSQGSIIYFLIFGSWVFTVLALRRLSQAYRGGTRLGTSLFLATLTLGAYSLYGYHDLAVYKGSPNSTRPSPDELKIYELIRQRTPRDAVVLHDYYLVRDMWSFGSLAARRAVVSSLYELGAINQAPELYHQKIDEANAFYSGQLAPAESQRFLEENQVAAILSIKRLHPGSGSLLDPQGYRKIADTECCVLWVREQPLLDQP
ncbi:MAG: hypothetical protein RRB13_08785 [bacterium]|nr:hypothetical protein [bacterium]